MQAILSFFVGWAYDHFAVGTDFTEGKPKEWFDWILIGKSKKGLALNLNHPLKNPQGIESTVDFAHLTSVLLNCGYSVS